MSEKRSRQQDKRRTAVVKRPAGRLADLPEGYAALLDDLKGRIRTAQVKAALAANRVLIRL